MVPECAPCYGVIFDADMRDGDVHSFPRDDEGFEYRMTFDTYQALLRTAGAFTALREAVEHLPAGVYPLPRSITNPDAASDLRQAIGYADLADPDGCVMPGCRQSVHQRLDGFNVCVAHHELLAGWDALTDAVA